MVLLGGLGRAKPRQKAVQVIGCGPLVYLESYQFETVIPKCRDDLGRSHAISALAVAAIKLPSERRVRHQQELQRSSKVPVIAKIDLVDVVAGARRNTRHLLANAFHGENML